MIRLDFLAKYIEELGKNLARLLAYEVNIEDENFLFHFNEMLRSYYRIDDEQLAELLMEDEERDRFLLAEDLKKKNIRTYLKAAKIYYSIDQKDNALICFQIVERIQNIQSGIFQFPTEEDQLIADDFKTVKNLLQ